jgi:hypothetical protein
MAGAVEVAKTVAVVVLGSHSMLASSTSRVSQGFEMPVDSYAAHGDTVRAKNDAQSAEPIATPPPPMTAEFITYSLSVS